MTIGKKRNLIWQRRGFTTLELLAVILIIAVLASLLFPALQKGLEKARAIKCAGNIRGIMAGETQYSADNNGDMVPYSTAGTAQDTISWPKLLAPYVTGKNFDPANNQWIQCPSQKQIQAATGNVFSGIGPVYTPGNNLHMLHGGNKPDTLNRVTVKRSSVRRPSQTPSWMDVSGGSPTGYPAYCRGCYPNGAGITDSNAKVTEANNFGARHDGRCNVGFADGHIEQVNLAILEAVPVKDGVDFFQHYSN